MKVPKPWLEQLTLEKLHRLALLIGSPCSGTKPVRIAGVQNALRDVARPLHADRRKNELSVVSIDMGIRNLAYTHLRASLGENEGHDGQLTASTPVVVETWRRISISDDKAANNRNVDGTVTTGKQVASKATRESFEPVDFANHAYKFIKHILDAHEPTHILIERQRFRSGGHSAVQEWTIRVGVFEGMLYAVLRALLADRLEQCAVIPMPPTRVNRFWLEKSPQKPVLNDSERNTSKAVKKMKIDLVGRLLEDHDAEARHIALSEEANVTKSDFMLKWKKEKLGRAKSVEGLAKLDDLSDSLLQGLAWVDWQKNRLRLRTLGQEAFDLDRRSS